MAKRTFLVFLVCITLLGGYLRLVHYSVIPPFGETSDEFIYPWAGMSLLQTGTPISWSPFGSYPTKYVETHWGETFSMVSPYIEKPFLYPLLTGSWMLVNGITEFGDVRLDLLRLIPISLSVISIFLLGLVLKEVINEKTALLAALIYATTPTIVLGNRLSLTENLLIPLTLLSLLVTVRLLYSNKNSPQPSLTKRGSQFSPFSTFSTFSTSSTFTVWSIHLIGVLCGLAINTKQIGLVLPISLVMMFITQKQWKHALTIVIYSFAFGLIHPITAWFYDWQTYVGVTEELRRAHALGLPEALYTLFRFPGIAHKEALFLDGTMLLGWILLLATPFLKLPEKLSQVFLFPLIYLVFILLGQGGQTWYGWHLFPMYPFLAISVAYILMQFFNEPSLQGLGVLIATLGSSSLRFWLLVHHSTAWQPYMIIMTGICFFLFLMYKIQKQSFLNPTFWIIFFSLLINIYTIMHLSQIYPSNVQPV